MTIRALVGSSMVLGLFLGACGSPPPAEPPAQPSATPPAASEAPVASAAPKASAEPEPAEAAVPTPPERQEPAFYPLDIVSAPNNAFILDYRNSGAYELAERKCANEPVEPPTIKQECMKKQKGKFYADVLQIKKRKDGTYVLIISSQAKTVLAEVYRAEVALTEIDKHKVKLEITKGGLGQRPIFTRTKIFEIEVPNGYSIVLNDPDFGRLPYDAKVGFVAE